MRGKRYAGTSTEDLQAHGRNAIGAAIALIKEQQLILDDMLSSGQYHGLCVCVSCALVCGGWSRFPEELPAHLGRWAEQCQ